MKKVVFIGAGAASITSAVLLKKREPSFDITIVEKDKKIGRKLSMTGGGKCNIAPLKDNPYVYNCPNFVEALFKDIPLKEYLSLLEEIGISTKAIKDYGYYPVHESAPQLVKNLYHQINKLGIKIIQDEFIDFVEKDSKVIARLKSQEIEADYLVLSTGGLTPVMKDVLDRHNVEVSKTLPGLCPIKVKEDVSTLFGSRFEAYVSLLYKGCLVKKYYGEVQFKKDGLSGIPVLNLSSLISRKMIEEDININDYQIQIELPKELVGDLSKITIEEASYMFLREEYANYIINKHHLNKKDLVDSSIMEILLSERFTVSSLYDYESSQLTVGGVSLDQIDNNFALKKNNHIFIVGEALNVDGSCGGYNLRFAITSGFKVISSLLK